MKKVLLLLFVTLMTNCNTSKRALPCKSCPHYSYNNQILLEYVKLNPYPHEFTKE